MSINAKNAGAALQEALISYIETQYFGKNMLLKNGLKEQLRKQGNIYQEPYIEASPAYRTAEKGFAAAGLPAYQLDFLQKLAQAKLGVFDSPFEHQVEALRAFEEGKDVFVSTGTGSGKTECFLWPLILKLAEEATTDPVSWEKRGVRAVLMYPMNALVSDQLSRLRRMMGREQFIRIFRETTGSKARRPQFGMYTGRTPYAGDLPEKGQNDKNDKNYKNTQLARILERFLEPNDEEKRDYYNSLLHAGRIPAKKDLSAFIERIRDGVYQPDPEDAELLTRFEMQKCIPDILITNYSMLEYTLMRPRERGIWDDTAKWLHASPAHKLLFIIDEAHMYRGSSGGEVSLLLRRLFYRLGIERDNVQFILTTASISHTTETEKQAVKIFSQQLTDSDSDRFSYIYGEEETLSEKGIIPVPFERFSSFNPGHGGDDMLHALGVFWNGLPGCLAPFEDLTCAGEWLFDHITRYEPFYHLMVDCRKEAKSLSELSNDIFPAQNGSQALHAVSGLLQIASLAKSSSGSLLFPARMHMFFRGIFGVYACTNPDCKRGHADGGLRMGEIFLSDEHQKCPHCGGAVYELFNHRRCGALFIRGFVETTESPAYLWQHPGRVFDKEMREIHLYIPPEGFEKEKYRGSGSLTPCYLDTESGFIDFESNRWAGQPHVRKLYYQKYKKNGKRAFGRSTTARTAISSSTNLRSPLFPPRGTNRSAR